MSELDFDNIEISGDLMGKVDSLAFAYYGDTSEVSRVYVTQVALELYFLWLELVRVGDSEYAEPILNWESATEQPLKQSSDEIQDWLFKRR